MGNVGMIESNAEKQADAKKGQTLVGRRKFENDQNSVKF